uniref:Retrotransposon Copia-like N-terminal domain-containing protein n=1 Tax=Solanum tuberosum TaxID=4113 RepID=M1DB75_SOLTU
MNTVTMVSPSSNAQIHLSLINVASFVSIKLAGRSNYIPWRTQIVCLLQSHDLLDFVDGTIQFPLPSIASADEPAKEEEGKGDGIEPPKEEEEKRDEIEPAKEEEELKRDEIEPPKEEEEKGG